jgi:hypothetical protein
MLPMTKSRAIWATGPPCPEAVKTRLYSSASRSGMSKRTRKRRMGPSLISDSMVSGRGISSFVSLSRTKAETLAEAA